MPLFCWFDHIFDSWVEIWRKNSYYLTFALFTRLILWLSTIWCFTRDWSWGCSWGFWNHPEHIFSRPILRLFLRLFTRLILRLFIRFLKSSRARILNAKLLPISLLSRPILRLFKRFLASWFEVHMTYFFWENSLIHLILVAAWGLRMILWQKGRGR